MGEEAFLDARAWMKSKNPHSRIYYERSTHWDYLTNRLADILPRIEYEEEFKKKFLGQVHRFTFFSL